MQEQRQREAMVSWVSELMTVNVEGEPGMNREDRRNGDVYATAAKISAAVARDLCRPRFPRHVHLLCRMFRTEVKEKSERRRSSFRYIVSMPR